MMSGVPTSPEEEVHFQTPLQVWISCYTQNPWQPQWHLNPTSPLPTSKRGLKGMQVPIPIFKNERYYNTFIRHSQGNCQGTRLEQSYGSQLSHQDLMNMAATTLSGPTRLSILSP